MNDILPQLGFDSRGVNESAIRQNRPQQQVQPIQQRFQNSNQQSFRQKLPTPEAMELQIMDALDAVAGGKYLDRGSIVDVVI